MILPPVPYVPRAYQGRLSVLRVWYTPTREHCDEARAIGEAAKAGASDADLSARVDSLLSVAVTNVEVDGDLHGPEALGQIADALRYEVLGAIAACAYESAFVGKS